jgi:hypothetical protein
MLNQVTVLNSWSHLTSSRLKYSPTDLAIEQLCKLLASLFEVQYSKFMGKQAELRLCPPTGVLLLHLIQISGQILSRIGDDEDDRGSGRLLA